jgi:hypothetical protein
MGWKPLKNHPPVSPPMRRWFLLKRKSREERQETPSVRHFTLKKYLIMKKAPTWRKG